MSCLAAGGQHAGAVLTTTMEGMDFDDDDGGGFSLPIGGDGVLWGCGEYGALGRGDVKDHPEAASCDTGSLAGPAITMLALGRACSAAIDTHGAVHVWGRGWGRNTPSSAACAEPRCLPPHELQNAIRQWSLPLPPMVRTICWSGRRLLMLCGPPTDSMAAGVAADLASLDISDGVFTTAPSSSRGSTRSGGPSFVLEASPGGAPPASLQSLDGLQLIELNATADAALAITKDGHCLRVPLDVGGSTGGAAGSRAQPLPLPSGDAKAARLAASRGHFALLMMGGDVESAQTPPDALMSLRRSLKRGRASLDRAGRGQRAAGRARRAADRLRAANHLLGILCRTAAAGKPQPAGNGV